jgi:hypothetical protein
VNLRFASDDAGTYRARNTLLRSRMAETEPPHIAIHWFMIREREASIALRTDMATGNRATP